MNPFWGKFGQRNNFLKTEVIEMREKLLEFVTNNEIEVSTVLPINDDIMYISYKNIRDMIDVSPITNVFIAAYTTAQARLKL